MKRSNKRNKMTVRGKIVIFLIILIVLFLVFNKFNEKSDVVKDDDMIFSQIEQNEQYDLKISFEKTNIKELDDKVKDYIIEKKSEFLKYVENKNNTKSEKYFDDEGNEIEYENKYDFVLDAQTVEYNNIIFINIFTYSYIGGAHYERDNYTLIYDKGNNKFLTIEDFINNDKFDELSKITKHFVYKVALEKGIELDEEMVNEGIAPITENYKHFYINDSGMGIIFIPYQVSSWSGGEFNVILSWDNINKVLKDEYKNNNIIITDNTEIIQEKRDFSKYKDKKLLAFTFDDGPNNKTTSMLLDGLLELDAKVTFFVVGNRISYNTEVIKRAYREGNDIGSHTYSHCNLLNLDNQTILEEINNTNNAINDVLGINPIYFRPPYGNINSHIKSLTMMHTICWDVDSEDWRLKDRQKIKDMILKNAHDGAVILLHDIYEESVMGALLAIKELKKEGYEFVTLTEMLELKEKSLDYDTTYYGF